MLGYKVELLTPLAHVSNVAIVGSQIASASLSGTSSTVVLNGVTAGNTLVIVYGARTPTYSAGNMPTLSDSQSQPIVDIDKIGGLSAASSGVYARIARITNALSGTHTITVQTTDIVQSGEITIYELSGVFGVVSGHNFSSSITTITISPLLTVGTNHLAIGGCGAAIVGGGGASFVWSGAGTQGSISPQDGTDANFCGLNGHRATPAGTQDFGAARQGTGTPNGMAVVGAVFT